MADIINEAIDPGLTYDQYQPAAQVSLVPVQLSSSAITDFNGLSGPSVSLGGGTTGYSFSVASPNITLTGPLTTKGDLYTHNGANGVRIAVGSNDSRLVADSTQATGLRWQAPSTGWTAATGTASRATYATYAGQTVSNPPTQTEVQNIDDHVKVLSQRLKALIDDLMSQKVLKA